MRTCRPYVGVRYRLPHGSRRKCCSRIRPQRDVRQQRATARGASWRTCRLSRWPSPAARYDDQRRRLDVRAAPAPTVLERPSSSPEHQPGCFGARSRHFPRCSSGVVLLVATDGHQRPVRPRDCRLAPVSWTTAAYSLIADGCGEERVALGIQDREAVLAVLRDPADGLRDLRVAFAVYERQSYGVMASCGPIIVSRSASSYVAASGHAQSG
jgi:hypothetical protein